MLAAKGVSGVTPKAMRGLMASLQTSLQNHDGKTVNRVGEGLPARWTVAP